MIRYPILGRLGPLISVGRFYGLCRKAGLGGGIMVLAFLPLLGLAFQSLSGLGMTVFYFGYPMNFYAVFYAVSALLGLLLGLIPLVVLLIVDWPGYGQDDTFR